MVAPASLLAAPSGPGPAALPRPAGLSQRAVARLRAPHQRGVFTLLDAGHRQHLLWSGADRTGQCRLYWLIQPQDQVIANARFLAFGSLASHPIADVFSEQVIGRTVQQAHDLRAEQIEALLRDDPLTPAFADQGLAPLAFLEELQARAVAEVGALVVPPRPQERAQYVRKPASAWTDEDRAWLPLPYLRKIAAVETLAARVVGERQALTAASRVTVTRLNEDFHIGLALTGVPEDQVPTLSGFIQDALRSHLHSALTVEAQP
jgi:NifU-like protein involved in Fe-S cluster formation